MSRQVTEQITTQVTTQVIAQVTLQATEQAACSGRAQPQTMGAEVFKVEKHGRLLQNHLQLTLPRQDQSWRDIRQRGHHPSAFSVALKA